MSRANTMQNFGSCARRSSSTLVRGGVCEARWRLVGGLAPGCTSRM